MKRLFAIGFILLGAFIGYGTGACIGYSNLGMIGLVFGGFIGFITGIIFGGLLFRFIFESKASESKGDEPRTKDRK